MLHDKLDCLAQQYAPWQVNQHSAVPCFDDYIFFTGEVGLLTATVTQHIGNSISNNELNLSLLYAMKSYQGDWGSEIKISSQTSIPVNH